MNLIITKTFRNDFLDIFKSEKLLDVFLKKSKETKLIYLGEDLYKFKFYIKTISCRGLFFLNINSFYIPVLLSKKSNKRIGNNLVLNSYVRGLLDTKFRKMSYDLEIGDYKKYS